MKEDAALSTEHDGNCSSTATADSSSSSSRSPWQSCSCLVSKATVSQCGGMVRNVAIMMMTPPVASWKAGCDWSAVGQPGEKKRGWAKVCVCVRVCVEHTPVIRGADRWTFCGVFLELDSSC